MDITGGVASSGGLFSPVNSRKVLMYDPKFHRWNKNLEQSNRMFSTPAMAKTQSIPMNRYSQVIRNASYIYIASF
jgi:hypothetical protein